MTGKTESAGPHDVDHGVVASLFFNPRSVAVIGASDDVRKPGARVLRNLLKHGYEGALYPVNPRTERVQGLTAHPSVAALPHVPDLAIIAVPAPAALASLRECGAAGVPAVTILSAVDLRNEQLQRSFAEAKSAHPGTHVVGPNSLGVHSTFAQLAGSFMTATDADFTFRESDVFIIAQSGGVGAYLLSAAESDGLPIGGFLSTGMELDVSFGAAVEGVVQRYSPSLIFGYLEGAHDHGRVSRALQVARANGTPVVLLRAGSTAAGRDAVARHSGLPPWDDREWHTSVDRQGALTVGSIPSAVDLGRTLVHPSRPSGRRLSIVAASGGAGILMTDAAIGFGFQLAHWGERQRNSIAQLLPEHAVVDNPIDATGAIYSPLNTLRRLLEACMEHKGTDVVVLTLGNMPHVEERLFDAIAEVAAQHPKLLAVVWSGGSTDAVRRLAQKGVLAFSDPTRCAQALSRSLDYFLVTDA